MDAYSIASAIARSKNSTGGIGAMHYRNGAIMLVVKWMANKVGHLDRSVLQGYEVLHGDWATGPSAATLQLLKLPIALVCSVLLGSFQSVDKR
jgi:hypothetical protein